MPSIVLSCDTVADISKDTLVPLQCEWRVDNGQPCPAVLGSWHRLEKHLLVHCKVKTHLGLNWLCKLPKCDMPVHSSSRALQEHVQSSHMARVVLPCPIANCSPPILMRLSQLSSHFEEEHHELDGKQIAPPHDILVPHWKPFPPAKLAQPCPIFARACPGSCLTKPVKPRTVPREVTALSAPSSQKETKKQRHQLSSKTEPEVAMPSITFDSIARVSCSETMPRIEEALFQVLYPGWSRLRDVSGSQAMHGFIQCQTVSPTIHYRVLARRMEELEK